MVHIRLFHHRQELPGIGGQRLHIAPLALGVKGVKGQGRFPGAGQAGDNHELVAGNIQIDILEIVGARAAHLYGIHRAPDTAVKSKQHSICPGLSAWQKQHAFYVVIGLLDVLSATKLVIYRLHFE